MIALMVVVVVWEWLVWVMGVVVEVVMVFTAWELLKLDGVGPIDNRSSTD